MGKNIVIIHGSNSRDLEKIAAGAMPQNKRNWILWVKENLEAKGFLVFNPLMPKNWEPDYLGWKKAFEKIPLNEESIIVGHSAGACFLVRYLSEKKIFVKKLILISPAIFFLKEDSLKSFADFSIDKTLKKRLGNLVIFTSNNDGEEFIKSSKIVHELLGGKLVCLENRGHFTEKDIGTNKFPELILEILK